MPAYHDYREGVPQRVRRYVTYETGTQTEVLWAGPPAAFATGGTSSSSAFALTAGGTGNYQQPVWRGLLFQQGRQNQVITMEGFIQLSGQASATTFTTVIGLNTSAGQATISGTLLSLPALTVTNFSSGSIWFKTTTICRGFGYGTSSVSMNLETSARYQAQLSTGSATTSQGVVNMTQLANIDGSLNQWVTITGQFNTNNAGNSATLNQLIVRGEN